MPNGKNDRAMLTMLHDIDFQVKEVMYHQCCLLAYETHAKSTPAARSEMGIVKKIAPWHVTRNIRNEAFLNIQDFIDKFILEKNEVLHSMKDITQHYNAIVSELGKHVNVQKAKVQNMKQKLKGFYGDKLEFNKSSDTGLVVYNAAMPIKEAVLHMNSKSIKTGSQPQERSIFATAKHN